MPATMTNVMEPLAPAVGAAHEAEFTQWYEVDRTLTNLENAYWNVMARPVIDEYWRQTQYLNRVNVPFVRSVTTDRTLAADLDKVRIDVASLVGVQKDEIALTRCGTESLQDLIIGYKLLKPGDEIVQVDNIANPSWEDVQVRIASRANQPVTVWVRRDGTREKLTVTPEQEKKSGMGLAGWDEEANQVAVVSPGMPAAQGPFRRPCRHFRDATAT